MYSISRSINTYAQNNQFFMIVLSLEPKNSKILLFSAFLSFFMLLKHKNSKKILEMYSISPSINTYALNNQLFMIVLGLQPKNSLKITKLWFFLAFLSKKLFVQLYLSKKILVMCSYSLSKDFSTQNNQLLGIFLKSKDQNC